MIEEIEHELLAAQRALPNGDAFAVPEVTERLDADARAVHRVPRGDDARRVLTKPRVDLREIAPRLVLRFAKEHVEDDTIGLEAKRLRLIAVEMHVEPVEHGDWIVVRGFTIACGSSRFTDRAGGVISGGMNRLLLERGLSSLSPKALREGRRSFLAWLAGGTALTAIGCVAGTEEEGGVLDPSPYDGEPDDGEIVETTEQGHHVCAYTSRDARGPYFEYGSPVRATRLTSTFEPGVPLAVEGRLIGPSCHQLLKGYYLDIWQADRNGNYYSAGTSNYRLRGKIKTDSLGRYRFETVLPGRYSDAAGMRPAHLHVSILTPGGNVLLTTQLYFKGDPYLGPADYCTAARTCNSADPKRHLALSDTTLWNRAAKKATFDAYLARA